MKGNNGSVIIAAAALDAFSEAAIQQTAPETHELIH